MKTAGPYCEMRLCAMLTSWAGQQALAKLTKWAKEKAIFDNNRI
jgi:hypothetical protein